MYFNRKNNFYHGIMFHHFHDDNPHIVGATIHLLSKGLDSGAILYHALSDIKNNSFVLVDARSRQRFEGKADEPRPELRRGSVPDSKNIPFQDCINSKINTFKTKSELIKIFNENNIDYFKPIVFSCGSGVTACVLSMAYFLITDKNAMIYDGSWSEYGKK